jgi:hypothetical protein
MLFDIVLPSIITIITIAIVWLYAKLETKIKSLLEEKEFSIRDAVFLVIAMGAMITVIVFVPHQAIQVLFLISYAFVLFLITYIASDKWYFSLLPPIVFIALYFSPLWNNTLVNIFAIIFAVFISVYLGGLFSWATVLVFAALLTIMDIIQVFLTGFMGAAAGKFGMLQLPVMIHVATFPREGGIVLGLGDIFLAGLLAIQTARKYNRKAGVISAFSIGFAFLVFEIGILNYEFAGYFPATLVVVFGWLAAFGIVYPKKWRTVGAIGGIACFLGALVIGVTMFKVTLELLGLPSILLVIEAVIICVLIIFGFLTFIIPYVLKRPKTKEQHDK